VNARVGGNVAEPKFEVVRHRSAGTAPAWNALESKEENVALKQYEEEYVASLETQVQSLQKQRHSLETQIQDLLAELEQTQSLKKEPVTP
jgi:predicted ribosome quality control (RQC) complex YloA/Tae2 family protein